MPNSIREGARRERTGRVVSTRCLLFDARARGEMLEAGKPQTRPLPCEVEELPPLQLRHTRPIASSDPNCPIKLMLARCGGISQHKKPRRS